MKKTIIALILLTLAVITYLILPSLNLTGRVTTTDLYSYSTAICDENKHCEDYLVECNGTLLRKLSATGFTIQQDSNWEDPRNKTEFCN